jgi:chromosome segregation ATPase
MTMPDLNPLSQHEVETEIRRLSDRLTFLTQHQATIAREAAQADVDYKLKHARTLLELRGHGGTVGEKEAQVLQICSQEYENAKIAEAVWKADQEAGRNLRSQLDALRTIAANIRDQVYHAVGRGG